MNFISFCICFFLCDKLTNEDGVTIIKDGVFHKLIIYSCNKADAALYRFEAEGRKSEATLAIQGQDKSSSHYGHTMQSWMKSLLLMFKVNTKQKRVTPPSPIVSIAHDCTTKSKVDLCYATMAKIVELTPAVE